MLFKRLAVAAGGCGFVRIGHVFAESIVEVMRDAKAGWVVDEWNIGDILDSIL